jgi:hypothetical protein
MDPLFFGDDDYDDGYHDGLEEADDSLDEIIDEFDPDSQDDYDWEISGAEMGLIGALASELSARRSYDVDENTDKENWEKAQQVAPLGSRHQVGSKLRPFEQYVQDYIKRGFKHPDD